MEHEQIIKALECCTNEDVDSCNKCPIYPYSLNMTQTECMETAMKNALALINELTEENEYLKELGTTKEIEKELVRRQTKADTVRKMQERLKQCFKVTEDGNAMYVENSVVFAIDQIAKEMLEENENG